MNASEEELTALDLRTPLVSQFPPKGTWVYVAKPVEKPSGARSYQSGYECSVCKEWHPTHMPRAKVVPNLRCDCDARDGDPTGKAFMHASNARKMLQLQVDASEWKDYGLDTVIRDAITGLLHLAHHVGMDAEEEINAAVEAFRDETSSIKYYHLA